MKSRDCIAAKDTQSNTIACFCFEDDDKKLSIFISYKEDSEIDKVKSYLFICEMNWKKVRMSVEDFENFLKLSLGFDIKITKP